MRVKLKALFQLLATTTSFIDAVPAAGWLKDMVNQDSSARGVGDQEVAALQLLPPRKIEPCDGTYRGPICSCEFGCSGKCYQECPVNQGPQTSNYCNGYKCTDVECCNAAPPPPPPPPPPSPPCPVIPNGDKNLAGAVKAAEEGACFELENDGVYEISDLLITKGITIRDCIVILLAQTNIHLGCGEKF